MDNTSNSETSNNCSTEESKTSDSSVEELVPSNKKKIIKAVIESSSSSDDDENEVSSSVINNSTLNIAKNDSNESDATEDDCVISSSFSKLNISETEDCENFSIPLANSTCVFGVEQDKNNSIINISDYEHETGLLELFSENAVLNKEPEQFTASEGITDIKKDTNKIKVTGQQYNEQKNKVLQLKLDIARISPILKGDIIKSLPDKGASLVQRQDKLTEALKKEEENLNNMVVYIPDQPSSSGINNNPSWKDLKAATAAVQPRTFGKQALETLHMQKVMTLDTLHELHGSLKTQPDENVLTEEPQGLKVPLMLHQKRALTWLLWREGQNPRGGILADDMGLGKTLTMISLMLKMKEINEDKENVPKSNSKKYLGGTLIVCPASLIDQWKGENVKHVRKGLISAELYHGSNREDNPRRLARHDMVITTYSVVMNEFKKKGTIFQVRWQRIVLDEAHQIRNHKSQTAEAACHLSANARWALTGTPIHNKELDLYSLLKFLRCVPFDDIAIWKRWVTDKSAGGQDRLNTVISSLLLRRTKQELQEKGILQPLPSRKWELITVTLDQQEMVIYQKVLVFSRTLFAQFLHQRAEKESSQFSDNQDNHYYKLHKKLIQLNKVKTVKQHEILVLLLRLRQICCHPSLILKMLEKHNIVADEEEARTINGDEIEGEDELNLLEQLKKLNIDDADENQAESSTEVVGLAEATRDVLNPSNPVFSDRRENNKIRAVLNTIKENILPANDKAIVVSQWPSYLNLIAYHLKKECVRYGQLDGSVPIKNRMDLVDRFNNPNHEMKVLLLSLTAGGVGLNLVGANHLLLMDLHWNPQLEMQAQDRIYRMGQNKPVFIYKFMTTDTIEERVKMLQDNKVKLAEALLSGSSKVQSSKLTINDLKLLFNM